MLPADGAIRRRSARSITQKEPAVGSLAPQPFPAAAHPPHPLGPAAPEPPPAPRPSAPPQRAGCEAGRVRPRSHGGRGTRRGTVSPAGARPQAPAQGWPYPEPAAPSQALQAPGGLSSSCGAFPAFRFPCGREAPPGLPGRGLATPPRSKKLAEIDPLRPKARGGKKKKPRPCCFRA